MKAFDWLLEHGAGDDRKVLIYALGSAAAGDNDEAFDRLRDLLGPASITPDLATKLLRQAAENGNARLVSYLLQFHPRLNGSPNDRAIDDPPLWAAAQHSCPDDGSHPNCDHRKVVRMLLDAGADARWFHPIYRDSVFFQVSDPEIAKMLLAAGADPNFKDTDGEPIIFSIDDEDVALVMIDAGLNLRSVRPADKMTLRGWATYEKWPRVLARLSKAGL
jgi:ankyrin repeat protein